MRAGSGICGTREGRSQRGGRSTTKSGRTAVWDIRPRQRLRPAWGRRRVVEKTLRLETPQKTRAFHFPPTPATASFLQERCSGVQTSYDLVREELGQVRSA